MVEYRAASGSSAEDLFIDLFADAFGAENYRVDTPEGFRDAFKKASECNGPCLIEVLIDKDEFVLPMLPPGGSIDDIIVSKERGE